MAPRCDFFLTDICLHGGMQELQYLAKSSKVIVYQRIHCLKPKCPA